MIIWILLTSKVFFSNCNHGKIDPIWLIMWRNGILGDFLFQSFSIQWLLVVSFFLFFFFLRKPHFLMLNCTSLHFIFLFFFRKCEKQRLLLDFTTQIQKMRRFYFQKKCWIDYEKGKPLWKWVDLKFELKL